MTFYRYFNASKGLNIKKGILLSVMALLFLFVPIAKAELLYQTGFESFSNGIIDGQQNWANSGLLDQITEAEAHRGNKSVLLPATAGSYTLRDLYSPAVDQTQSQKLSFWIKVEHASWPVIIWVGSYQSLIVLQPPIPVDGNWHYVQSFFDIGVGENTFGHRVDNGAWATTTQVGYPTYYYIDKVLLRSIEKTSDVYIDDFYFGDYEKIIPSAFFTSPANDSYISTSPLNLQIEYSNFSSEFKQIILNGCSETTPQCIPTQIKNITTTSGVNNFLINAGITKGIWNFNLTIKDENGDIFLPSEFGALTLDFLLDYDAIEFPTLPEAPETPEFTDPYDFYFENTEYETTTALFNSLTNSFGAGFIWIYNLLDIFDYFELNTTIGQNIGEAVATGRAYLGNINAFFGDLPMTQMFLLYLGVMLIIGILRFIKYIRNLLPFV